MKFKVLDVRTGQEAYPAVVWVAHGAEPDDEHDAEFWLSRDGSLIILEHDGNFHCLNPDHYEVVPT